jgi:hypothetical protein
MSDGQSIPEVEPTEQIRPTLAYVTAGRAAFEGLLRTESDELVEAVWRLGKQELRAIVFERVVARQFREQ